MLLFCYGLAGTDHTGYGGGDKDVKQIAVSYNKINK